MRNASYVQNNNKKFKNINYISLHFLLIFICVLMKKFLVGNSVFGNIVKEVLNNMRIRDRRDIEVVDDANYTVGKKCKFPLHFTLFLLALFIDCATMNIL